MKRADREDFLKTVPVLYRGRISRAFAGVPSLRGAITAKCLDCSNFDRDEITNCTVSLCPLFEYRPYQKDRPHRPATGKPFAKRSPESIPSATERGERGQFGDNSGSGYVGTTGEGKTPETPTGAMK